MQHKELVKMDHNVSLLIHVINHNKNISMTSSEVLVYSWISYACLILLFCDTILLNKKYVAQIRW